MEEETFRNHVEELTTDTVTVEQAREGRRSNQTSFVQMGGRERGRGGDS